MGIKKLNNFITNTCKESIKKITFYNLKNKVIVVDTSIYLYRFKSDNMLIDGFYQLITKFKFYNIIPIFIFDGKPMNNKNYLLDIRKNKKLKAKNKYYNIKKNLINVEDELIIKKYTKKLVKLEKKITSITKKDVYDVKCLFRHMNVYYYNAPYESDSICAKFVINNIAYACLSDDMDLFVYGCPRVLRYLSILKSNLVLYDYNQILKSLNLDNINFKKLCILSGTDYNLNCESIDLYKGYKLYNIYKYSNYDDYIKWLIDNNIIKYEYNIDEIIEIFNLDNINMEKYVRKYNNKENNKEDLEKFLENYGYIFI